MEEVKNSKNNILWLWITTFILTVILMPFFGKLYYIKFGPITNTFWGPSHPEYFEGFFLSYYLIFSFLCHILLKKPWKTFCFGIFLPILFFSVLIGAWQELKIEIILIIIGLVLGWGIKVIIQKIKSSKT
ncbi:MAG: hypothetical protein WCW02_02520 [Candidatus Buchananbacteria bacterium]